MRFKLGDWVRYDPEVVAAYGGREPQLAYMVVDLYPCGHKMVVARINPITGKPFELLTAVGAWVRCA